MKCKQHEQNQKRKFKSKYKKKLNIVNDSMNKIKITIITREKKLGDEKKIQTSNFRRCLNIEKKIKKNFNLKKSQIINYLKCKIQRKQNQRRD